MPESTFTVTFDELAAEVGRFLGYGRGTKYGETAWNARQQSVIDMVVKAGVHRFYYPEPLPGEISSHTWSFLQPVATLTLASGATTVDLPLDFAGFEGPLSNMTSGARPTTIPFRSTGFIDQQYANMPNQTGRPLWVAERPKKLIQPGSGQRKELYFFPEADQAYSLQGYYYLLPNFLDGTHQHCYGGAEHGQTIIASCLAVAEDRQLGIGGGPQGRNWMVRLASSVSMDRRNKPASLGIDVGGEPQGVYGWQGLPTTQVTVNGVQY